MKEKCDAVRFNLVQALGNLKEKSKLDGYEQFIGDNIIKFSEDERKFYDFQVFVTFDGDRDPIIGYKNKNSEGLEWNHEGGN